MSFKLKNHIIGKTYEYSQENMQEMLITIDGLRGALDELVNKLTYHYQGREEVVLNLRHKDIERYRRLIKGGE